MRMIALVIAFVAGLIVPGSEVRVEYTRGFGIPERYATSSTIR